MADAFRYLQRRATEVTLSDAAGRSVRQTRKARGLTQVQLARRAGVSRSLVSKVECARRPVSIASVAAIADAMSIRVEFMLQPPFIPGSRTTRDTVHARCVVYVERRMVAAGWIVVREAPIGRVDAGGFIDILAWNPLTGALLVIEVKTQLRDFGEIERTLGWYERAAVAATRTRGWKVRDAAACLLCLDSREVAETLRDSRSVVEAAFPVGATALARWLDGGADSTLLPGRALGLIDPTRRAAQWLIGARSGGRRRSPKFEDYADAASQLTGRPRGPRHRAAA